MDYEHLCGGEKEWDPLEPLGGGGNKNKSWPECWGILRTNESKALISA